MSIPVKRDVEILQYLYNEQHSTEEAAKEFEMTPGQISMVVYVNACNMSNLMRDHHLEHAKNICMHEYGLSRECIDALISQVTPYREEED